MANWTGAARSNYFRVKNTAEFMEFASIFPVRIQKKDDTDLLCVLSTAEDGGMPDCAMDGGDEKTIAAKYCGYVSGDEAIDMADHIAQFLVDGEVAIFMWAGHEGQRYITGGAVAYHADGRTISVDLNDIYKLVQEEFGVIPSRAVC